MGGEEVKREGKKWERKEKTEQKKTRRGERKKAV
jgi:hypothetical protein